VNPFILTENYDGTVAFDTGKQFLTRDRITPEAVAGMKIEVNGYCTSPILNTWYGNCTIGGEQWVSSREDDSGWKGLTFKDNMLAYKMQIDSTTGHDFIYGMCFFTGASRKYVLWEAEEDLQLRRDMAKHDRRNGRVHRGMFTKRRNLNLDKPLGVVALKDHRPNKQTPEEESMDLARESETSKDGDDSFEKLMPTENPEKKRMYWILIIGGISLIVIAIVLIVLFLFVLTGSDSSSDAPATIVLTAATTGSTGNFAILAFTEPDTNGAAISAYTCSATASGATTTHTGSATCVSSACTFNCRGLSPDITYAVTLVATNEVSNGLASNSLSVTTVDSQRIALAALWNGAGGAKWGQDQCPLDTTFTSVDTSADRWGTSAFNTTGDYCVGWGGLTCDVNGLITALSLDSYHLVGTIPTEIGTLTGLTNLNFARNPNNFKKIGGSGANSQNYCQFNAFQRGTATTGGAGGLSGSIPTEIGNLVNLGTLNLQSTYLSGTVPTQFNALSALTEFKMSKSDSLCYATTGGTVGGVANTGTSGECSTANSLTTPTACASGSCSVFQTKLKTLLDTTGQCCTVQDDGKTDLICDANQAC